MKKNVLEFLEHSARRRPDHIAVADEMVSLSYRQLLRRARAMGTALIQALHGQTRRAVFVRADRTADTAAALMGVLYSGCYYVPVDASLPEERIEKMAAAARPAALLFPEKQQLHVPLDTVKLTFEQAWETVPDEALLARVRSCQTDQDPVYALFTSGSTGIPKGVLVAHRSVLDFVEAFGETFHLEESAVFGGQAPFDFDVSVKDLYGALRVGGTLQILPRAGFSFPGKLMEYLRERKVNTLVWAVSAMRILASLNALKDGLPLIRQVFFSGEVIPEKTLRYWMGQLPQAEFVNLYGPTEITCNCLYYRVERNHADGEALPVGIPFSNCQVFLLDGDREITAPGETGELCVRGTCLALGYVGDPVRTAQAFVQDPRQNDWPERIYRTGDLGAYREDGQLLFLGRKDSQVKHMGHRIELQEIELAAGALPEVTGCCCLYDTKRERVVLFYEGPGEADAGIFRALRKKLPRFMLPGKLFYLPRLPLNEHGKIDRTALCRRCQTE